MNWAESNVFITGIDGFLGSNMAVELLRLGAAVSGIIHRPLHPSKSGLLAQGIAGSVKTYMGDVADSPFVEAALADAKPQNVFHLAAESIVVDAQNDAFIAFESNVRGTWNVVYQASRLPSLRAVVVASSDKAYGASPQLPYTESMPLRGAAVYGTSKACADLIARSLAERFGLPVGVTRCANIYGPGDLNFSRIVPDTIAALLRGEPPTIRGTGRDERDMIYVADTVSGYLRLADYVGAAPAAGEAFNFGTGSPLRMIDLVNTIIAEFGPEGKQPHILGRESCVEIDKQSVDSTKARKLLGWAPTVPLNEGLTRTIAWYRRHLLKDGQQ